MTREDLDTPVLTVDLEIMERNLLRMSEYCKSHGLELRPHSKTHKIPELAWRQLELGAAGITVAKVGEAEVMSSAGIHDLLLAYPLFGDAKARRLQKVLERCRVTVALDSRECAEWVSWAADGGSIDVLIEVDMGLGRCGIPPGRAAVDLARQVEGLPGLRFAGLFFYPGHLHPEYDGQVAPVVGVASKLARLLELFEKEGLQVERVSGGSTPSASCSHRIPGLTEIRPGTYIFNDRNTVEWKTCTVEDCAARVQVTVVSTSVPGKAIIDGGSKTFSGDRLASGAKGGFGFIVHHPDIEFEAMNEEHGYLKLPERARLRVGDRLEIIPNHVCTCVNMHDVVYGLRSGRVEKEWPVAARGRIR